MSRLKKSFKPEHEMRKKIDKTIRVLDLQREKLDQVRARLERKDKHYFNKAVKALATHKKKKAVVYANEMAEVRKALKSINQTKLAIEQISLRLSTVKDIGDIVTTIAPATSILRTVRGNLSDVLPKADEQFGIITELLGSILFEVGQMGGLTINFSAANFEAEKILNKAEAQVEKEIKAQLPSVPSVVEKEEISL
ncbi:MAG: hypothetical protein GTN80_09520 [Nitrososphaeria archaeon]|nr:hypothetical protein [Nitrososphaeria archaeon]NIQ33860.1 hypothetical protein [Nitrososphaeria archaeon]